MKQRLMFFTLGLCLTGALLMPAAPPASAQLFGESDKDKAARLQREDDQEAANRQMSGGTQPRAPISKSAAGTGELQAGWPRVHLIGIDHPWPLISRD